MLFNSVEFFLFLPTVFLLYWFVLNKNLKIQNVLLLISSYFFYAWWDWRFLILLFASTLIDYAFGLAIYRSANRKKLYLWISIVNNLAILGFFKYYNFFANSTQDLLNFLGFEAHPYLLSIALPVGISFYTFHGMSYVFDIYRDKAKPTTDFVNYAVFVCFFPLLVAGPIERGTHLLPQIERVRNFSYRQASQGIRLIIWGLFKKVVIADSLASIVNKIFDSPGNHSGATLVLGAIYFSFQIYGDFSGYTDIALGTAKLFGFELLSNFRFPYFSRDIAEFWRRWHISLSSWFRDYLYIPLGGSKEGKAKAIRNTFIIFLVSGFWHGANWTFIMWGFVHALLFIPLLVSKKNRVNTGEVVAYNRPLPNMRELGQMLFTFLMLTFAWIFFRSPNIGFAFNYLGSISKGIFSVPQFLNGLVYVIVFLCLDWTQRQDERNVLCFNSAILRKVLYFTMTCLIVFHFEFINKAQFIYFQF